MDPEQDIVGTEATKKADEERANFKPIKLEDTGFFPAFALSQKPRSQVIRWQQDLNDREESYTLVVFEYTGNSEDKTPCHARLFISDSAMAQFQATLQPVVNPSSSTPWHAFTVTNDFQYGQLNEAGEARFLVYHKKESKPYQVRVFFFPAEA
ncbi:uncharacterized protein N7500_000440 [Penicillium coprophilum]|uniref:uncharacterized protein n=1 Tax=Penicillium coprophilum TaxID=36646 RepID=UPI00238D613D|nr:uncharacterized protein N7500_000440 [Penicillium coprophilum]KAJ5177741.1 hypothetical protein N7500_000440 [Penicillium coprophilum]